jgi:signal transduction histidine kinase
VFDRYFQASRVERTVAGSAPPASGVDASSTRHHAGLGLAITRRIVALHGGEIHVASTLGVGTMFSFDLPLSE